MVGSRSLLEIYQEWTHMPREQLEELTRESGVQVLTSGVSQEDYVEFIEIGDIKHMSWFAEYNGLQGVVIIECPDGIHEQIVFSINGCVYQYLGDNAYHLAGKGATTCVSGNAIMEADASFCGRH
jgi:hypothetical protein